jgi:hypothetical protein
MLHSVLNTIASDNLLGFYRECSGEDGLEWCRKEGRLSRSTGHITLYLSRTT